MGTAVKLVKCIKADIIRAKNKKWDFRSYDKQRFVWPFYCLIHPFAGISGIKYEKKGSVAVANGILFFYFITNIVQFFYTGFIFNMSNIEEFNIVLTLMSSVVLIVLWTVSNWSVCTLMDGEGNFTEIWTASCYALTPIVVTNFISVLLSNLLTNNENVFIGIVNGLGMLWAVMLIVIGMLIVHQYTLTKTIVSCMLTVFGIAAIIFMIILFISIVQQMYGFISTITIEILNRT